MKVQTPEKKGVSAEQAQKLLEKHGVKISLEEAKIILEFMYEFGKLTIDQYVKI